METPHICPQALVSKSEVVVNGASPDSRLARIAHALRERLGCDPELAKDDSKTVTNCSVVELPRSGYQLLYTRGGMNRSSEFYFRADDAVDGAVDEAVDEFVLDMKNDTAVEMMIAAKHVSLEHIGEDKVLDEALMTFAFALSHELSKRGLVDLTCTLIRDTSRSGRFVVTAWIGIRRYGYIFVVDKELPLHERVEKVKGFADFAAKRLDEQVHASKV